MHTHQRHPARMGTANKLSGGNDYEYDGVKALDHPVGMRASDKAINCPADWANEVQSAETLLPSREIKTQGCGATITTPSGYEDMPTINGGFKRRKLGRTNWGIGNTIRLHARERVCVRNTIRFTLARTHTGQHTIIVLAESRSGLVRMDAELSRT